MKIGFFDSGLGGLVILKAVAKMLPLYDYEFYGDTANLPYGDKSEIEIRELTRLGILHLFKRDCLLVVVACNTASSETLRYLQETILVGEYADHRILGVIIPTVEVVMERGDKRVTLLATKRTVESEKYKREFAKYDQAPELITTAETRLVQLLEAGEVEKANAIIKTHIVEAIKNNCDSLILGCTHFSLLKEYARSISGGELNVIAQDELIPLKLKQYLSLHKEIEVHLSHLGRRTIYLTNPNQRYDKIISSILEGKFMRDS